MSCPELGSVFFKPSHQFRRQSRRGPSKPGLSFNNGENYATSHNHCCVIKGGDKFGSRCYTLFNVVLENALRDYKQEVISQSEDEP